MKFLEYSLSGAYPCAFRTHRFPTAETSQRMPGETQATGLAPPTEGWPRPSCHGLPLIVSYFNSDFLVFMLFPGLASHPCDKIPDIQLRGKEFFFGLIVSEAPVPGG